MQSAQYKRHRPTHYWIDFRDCLQIPFNAVLIERMHENLIIFLALCGTVIWSIHRAYPYFLDTDDALDAFQSKYISEKYSPKHFVKWRRKMRITWGITVAVFAAITVAFCALGMN